MTQIENIARLVEAIDFISAVYSANERGDRDQVMKLTMKVEEKLRTTTAALQLSIRPVDEVKELALST